MKFSVGDRVIYQGDDDSGLKKGRKGVVTEATSQIATVDFGGMIGERVIPVESLDPAPQSHT